MSQRRRKTKKSGWETGWASKLRYFRFRLGPSIRPNSPFHFLRIKKLKKIK